MSVIPDDALHETWDSIYRKSVRLAELIKADCQKTSQDFDAMVVVPRGAYYPANIASRELGFGAVDLLHASIGSYKAGSTRRSQKFAVGQMPASRQVRGKKLLVIEEVCDQGYTLQYLVDYLMHLGAKSVQTGVLHYKPKHTKTGFIPDWYVSKTDKWIVYPWEVHDSK